MKRVIYALADSPRVTGWIARRGMGWGFARRFIAGEGVDEALPAVKQLRKQNMFVTLDYLGEAVRDEGATRVATDAYCGVLDRLNDLDNIASISLKPTQLGLSIDPELARTNIQRIASQAARYDNFVRIDMEDSGTTQATLDVFKSLLPDHSNLGTVVQSYLHRTEADVRELAPLGAKLRLCKGAYQEPAEVAFQSKSEVDASYIRCAEILLQEGNYPAFATHDHRIIEHLTSYADRNGIGKERFEIQMLFGIRRDYQQEIADAGFNIRIYVPFGEEWCPYFMRRIAERPSNAFFVVRALAGS